MMRGQVATFVTPAAIVAALTVTLAAGGPASRETGVPAAAAAPAEATELRAVRAESTKGGVVVALVGNGRLVAASVEEARDLPARVLLDFKGVAAAAAVPAVVPVNQGGVTRVRIGANSRSPLVTRVVVDLARKMPFRVGPADDGDEVRVIFGEAAGETPAAAVAPAAAAAAPVATSPLPDTSALVARVASSGATATIAQAPATNVMPPMPAAGGQAPPQRFTGQPVSLDFQGADLRAVLRTFAEVSGLNIVIDPAISGTVDVALRDVPWDQALDIILKANKLGYSVDGTIVRIAPLGVLADEESQRRKLAEEQALSGELRILTRPLSYARAAELVPIVTRSSLSPRGEVQVDARTNTIIIRDLADRLQGASELIAALDQPQPQVEIEARIVQTSRDFARSLGVQWGVGARSAPELGNTTGLAFPNNGSITGRSGGVQGPNGVPTAVNLPAAAAANALGLALGSVNGAVNLDVALSAIERTGNGRILSTPRVSTQNNVEAEITQGIQIPIQTVANNTVTVTFKDAALTLKVTPQITASNTVIMKINVENASPDFSRSVNNIPPIDTQRALTTVLVGDGETTVIGGIYISREQAVQGRTPLLHQIPLLGWLFKRDEISDESRELLIFITPRITRG